MIYKDFQNLKLSALGMGCMRLPVLGGNSSVIDQDAVDKMVSYSMENGINYFLGNYDKVSVVRNEVKR